MLRTKGFAIGEGRDVPVFGPDPPPEHLPLIGRYALSPVGDGSQFYVRRMALANDAVDRDDERFTEPVLQRFAATLPGKALLLNHAHESAGSGLCYQAAVRPSRPGEPGLHTLDAYFYVPKTPATEPVRQAIDAGSLRHGSIGFQSDERFCSQCGKAYYECPHLPGEKAADGSRVHFFYGGDPERYEAAELSLVYLGAQRGAGIKSGGVMENEKALARIKELEEQVKRIPELEKAAAGSESHAAVLKELETAKRDLAALTAQDGAKALLATDGAAYREHLKGEVRRYAGILECEAEADLILTAAPHAEAKGLAALVESYKKRAEKLFPPAGHARPNTGTGEAPDTAPAGSGPGWSM